MTAAVEFHNPLAAVSGGAATTDLIRHVKLSTARLPLAVPISDAKVLHRTPEAHDRGRLPLRRDHHRSRATAASASATPSAPAGRPSTPTPRKSPKDIIGEDPNDIGKLYTKLLWAGASVGRSGVATQALAAIDIALYDLKAKRAGLPLAKFLGSYRDSVQTYNTSGGFLNASLDEVKARATSPWTKASAASRSRSACRTAERTCAASPASASTSAGTCRSWSTPTSSGTAPPPCAWAAELEEFNLVWIEEPLDAYDFEGHAHLARVLDTPIATGEMLASVAEHKGLINANGCDIIQPDAPRVGGITQFLRLAALADERGLEPGPALRHGNPPPPRRRLPARTVGGALRLARPAVQRAPRNQGRPHARSGPPRPRHHPQRPGARLDHGDRGVRTGLARRSSPALKPAYELFEDG